MNFGKFSIFRSKYSRSIGALVGSTAVAQCLTFITLPILTRIYSPSDFSVLAAFMAALNVITVISCLRLEMAIPLPEDDVEASNVLAICILIVCIITLTTFSVLFFLSPHYHDVFQIDHIRIFTWLLPLGVFFSGVYLAFQFWCTRKRQFGLLAQTKITQVGSGLIAQFSLGWMGMGAIGLLIGQVVAGSGGVTSILCRILRNDRSIIRQTSWSGMRKAAWKYRKFPKYSTFEAFANEAAFQLPILLIAALASSPQAGYAMLAIRAIGMPVTLIGGAVKQVFTSRAPEALREGRLPELTSEMLRGMAITGVAPLILAAIVAPGIFSIAFGEKWRPAGELVSWMAPWFIFKLLSSPLAMVMHVQMKQRGMLLLMIIGLILNLGGTIAAYIIKPTFIVQGYALSSALFYAISLITYTKSAGISHFYFFNIIKTLILPIIAAISIGMAFNVFIEPWVMNQFIRIPGA